MTRRESHHPTEGTLDETLGEESCGMVVVDAGGHPMKYDQLAIMENAVATQNVRVEVDVPAGPDGRGWKRTQSFTESQNDKLLGAQWCQDIQRGASHILEETWVKANDSGTAKILHHF